MEARVCTSNVKSWIRGALVQKILVSAMKRLHGFGAKGSAYHMVPAWERGVAYGTT